MGWFTDLISAPYNAATGNLTQMQKDALVAQNNAEIETTVSNAQKYFGDDSAGYEAARETASYQEQYTAADINQITTENSADCATTLPIIGCVKGWEDFLSKLDTGVKLGIGLVAVLILGWVVVTFGPAIAAVTRVTVKGIKGK